MCLILLIYHFFQKGPASFVIWINLWTGRCDLRVFVEVPVGTELLSPLDENCIWCQVRGSGSEISVLSQGEGQITNPEKVPYLPLYFFRVYCVNGPWSWSKSKFWLPSKYVCIELFYHFITFKTYHCHVNIVLAWVLRN